jgi:O-antigen/teichoic acid export membrane protein
MLVIGDTLSIAFTAIAIVIVARLLGPEAYGLYTLAFVAPSILMQLWGLGVNVAVTRYAAFYLSKGEIDHAVQITKRATTFLLLFGVVLSLANYYLAPYMAVAVLGRAALIPYIQLTSIFIIAQAAQHASGYALVGWNLIKELSLFSILQAVLRLAISPALILIGFGIYGAVLGTITSYVVQGAAALLTLYALKLRSPSKGISSFVDDIKTLIGYGLQIFAGSLAFGWASQYILIILASVATNRIVGEYQAAVNLTIPISVISNGVTTVLVRSFSTLHGLKEDITQTFDYAVRYVSFLLTPVLVFLFSSAGLLFDVIYSQSYTEGVIFLQLTAISYIPVAFGLTVLPSFLNGIGKNRFVMLMNMAGASSLVVAGLGLAVWSGLGGVGIVYAIIISNVITTVLGLFLSVRLIRTHLTFGPLLSIIAAALMGSIVMYYIPDNILPPTVLLLVNVIIFTFVYLSLVPLFRGVNLADVDRLALSTEGIHFLGRVVKPILNYERWILRKSGAPPSKS